jgi:hypothetical protein
VTDADDVHRAALRRAAALVAADRTVLLELLHPDFRWTSHTGEVLDREAYIDSNTGGGSRWSSQDLVDPDVVVVQDTGVLRCLVVDAVDRGRGKEEFRMPMTQVWVRSGSGWACLAGHAGPRLPQPAESDKAVQTS